MRNKSFIYESWRPLLFVHLHDGSFMSFSLTENSRKSRAIFHRIWASRLVSMGRVVDVSRKRCVKNDFRLFSVARHENVRQSALHTYAIHLWVVSLLAFHIVYLESRKKLLLDCWIVGQGGSRSAKEKKTAAMCVVEWIFYKMQTFCCSHSMPPLESCSVTCCDVAYIVSCNLIVCCLDEIASWASFIFFLYFILFVF